MESECYVPQDLWTTLVVVEEVLWPYVSVTLLHDMVAEAEVVLTMKESNHRVYLLFLFVGEESKASASERRKHMGKRDQAQCVALGPSDVRHWDSNGLYTGEGLHR